MANRVKFSDILKVEEAAELKAFVAKGRSVKPLAPSVNKLVHLWLEAHPAVLGRWEKIELLPSYAAYLLEHILKLE